MTSDTTPTRLLRLGALAGPLYVGVGILEVALRPGFDIRRHALSLMSNGDWGWVQIASFVLSGVLVIAGAIGLKGALAGGRGGKAVPILLMLYGLGLIGAGFFVADPMDGFPIGTLPGPPATMSWHGPLHFMAGGIGFIGLIGAALVMAARHFGRRETGAAVFALFTGLFFLGAFMAIASGKHSAAINLSFSAAGVGWWGLLRYFGERLASLSSWTVNSER